MIPYTAIILGALVGACIVIVALRIRHVRRSRSIQVGQTWRCRICEPGEHDVVVKDLFANPAKPGTSLVRYQHGRRFTVDIDLRHFLSHFKHLDR